MLNVERDNIFYISGFNLLNYFDELYVLDVQQNLIYSLGSEQETLDVAKNLLQKANQDGNYVVEGKNTYFFRIIPCYTSWTLVGVTSNKKILNDFYTMVIILSIIGGMAIITAIIISKIISDKVTRPISAISARMASFEFGEIPDKILWKEEQINQESKILLEGLMRW
jgi:sensor histidine kinase YesM